MDCRFDFTGVKMLPHPKIIYGDALNSLKNLPDLSYDFVFIDPPFNTNKKQKIVSTGLSYIDKTDNYKDFIYPVLQELHRIISDCGSIFILADYREIHYIKVWMDEIFGRNNFRNELIWHFELGGISKKQWTNKHNTILWYSKSENYIFNFDKVPMTTRKYPKKGYEGDKKLCSVFDYTLSNTHPERVGYPNQKPLWILNMLMDVHTNSNSLVLDCFAGSGTTGHAAMINGLNSVMIESNEAGIKVMEERFSDVINTESLRRHQLSDKI